MPLFDNLYADLTVTVFLLNNLQNFLINFICSFGEYSLVI